MDNEETIVCSKTMISSILNGDESPHPSTINDYPDAALRAIFNGEDEGTTTTSISSSVEVSCCKKDATANNNDFLHHAPVLDLSSPPLIKSCNNQKRKIQEQVKSKRKNHKQQYHLRKYDICSLQQFKLRKHSLYLSASQIAAMVGLHPYSNIPKLVMDLVYQGKIGKLLLQHDAKLLQISLIDEEESLRKIAKKGGQNVQKLLEESMKIANGKKHVANVDKASDIKKNMLTKIQDSSKQLSAVEMKLLLDGMRHNVNTGYGKAHEENALDVYEKQCGCEVRERNAERMCWKFNKAEDCKNWDHSSTIKTVVPVEKANASNWNNIKSSSTCTRQAKMKEDLKENLETTSTKYVSNEAGTIPSNAITIHSSQEDDGNAHPITVKSTQSINQPIKQRQKPYFSINGVVDGIRDEIYHVPSVPIIQEGIGIPSYHLHPQHMNLQYSDDNEWELRQVIVECKHRMNKAFNPPPMYDQIQAVVYALMYETSEADIIQVVRKEVNKTSTSSSKRDKESNRNENSEEEPAAKPLKSIEITSHRVSLDEPTMQHRQNWTNTVLPRLRSFIDAVYTIREHDDKRFQLLYASSLVSSGGNDSSLWKIVHDECPWLLDCDTAFSRNGKPYPQTKVK